MALHDLSPGDHGLLDDTAVDETDAGGFDLVIDARSILGRHGFR